MKYAFKISLLTKSGAEEIKGYSYGETLFHAVENAQEVAQLLFPDIKIVFIETIMTRVSP